MMEKHEAIKAMEDGEKVTHKSFTKDEWMKLTGQLFEFEDGIRCQYDEFWDYRSEKEWDSGWEIFRELGYVDDSFKTIPAKNSMLKKQAF
jgi:hypothetical protein